MPFVSAALRAAMFVAFAATAACATHERTAREAAYQQCLEDNMAAAMAWEAIEQSCRERVNADDNPLDFHPPEED